MSFVEVHPSCCSERSSSRVCVGVHNVFSLGELLQVSFACAHISMGISLSSLCSIRAVVCSVRRSGETSMLSMRRVLIFECHLFACALPLSVSIGSR